MKERPIIFSGRMVKPILDGRKTQTRRVVKRSCDTVGKDVAWAVCPANESGWIAWFGLPRTDIAEFTKKAYAHGFPCPYGQPGDRLWVREAAYIAPLNFGDPQDTNCVDENGQKRLVGYAASMDSDSVRAAKDYGVKLSPSIHMPRWASRLTLEIAKIRVERLQEINEQDATAEGTPSAPGLTAGGQIGMGTARYWFKELWDSINAKGGFGWDVNPWVWAIEFKSEKAAR